MPNQTHTYHKAKMRSCVAQLEAKGYSAASAHRICYSVLGGASANESIQRERNARALLRYLEIKYGQR